MKCGELIKSERKRSVRKKGKKKHVKHGRISWWKKCKGRIVFFFTERMKGEKKGKGCQKKNIRPRARQVLGKSGRWLFLLLLLGQNWLYDNAAAEGLQRRTEMMERMRQQEVQVKESRWMEENPQRWRQPKGPDRTEVRKEEKRLRCVLLGGSTWNTEKKYMRR